MYGLFWVRDDRSGGELREYLWYIGMTAYQDLASWIRQHYYRNETGFNAYRFVYLDQPIMIEVVEARLIGRYSPPMNDRFKDGPAHEGYCRSGRPFKGYSPAL